MGNIQIKNMNNLLNNSSKIPFEALQDIDKRIGDWLAMGGNIEDGYIKQQFRYAERFVNMKEELNDAR